MANNEVFTPRWYIEKLDKTFNSINGPILDNCCGHGVWLKYAQDKGFEVYGCDIEEENCVETIKKLYGDGKIEIIKGKEIPEIFQGPGLIAVFKHNGTIVNNVVQADSFTYSMNFDSKKQPISFGPSNLFETLD